MTMSMGVESRSGFRADKHEYPNKLTFHLRRKILLTTFLERAPGQHTPLTSPLIDPDYEFDKPVF